MECSACGRSSREDARFCDGCGATLATPCIACGRQLRPEARFCDACGQSVEAAAERSPHEYTPKHLADKILRSRSALEGERKQVTVLFADVKGSMELAERVDPEAWHAILDRFFQILADGVHRFEGTVNQYTGDGIMALFGAPIAHEDHAQRACYAALHLRDELRRYAVELRREQGFDFSVRMGLNSGEVVVGKIGDDLRMDYTAQGHTVGLAARMQALAEAGKPYLAEETASRVDGYFQLEDLGEFQVKGADLPVRVSALEGVGTLRTRFDVSRSRGLSAFVGRGDETQALESALAAAMQGAGRAVGVVADAGVGKSRLCFEFAERCRARGIPVREAHGVPHGLRGYFGIGERDSGREVRQKIAGTLLLLDRELEEALPLLFEFLGAPDPQRPAPDMVPEARQRRLFGALRRVVQARSHEEPSVTLVEDLHWLDAGSDAFLASLVEALPGTRTLLLVNFRPEYRADWMGKPVYQQLPLVPLGAEAMRKLVGTLLGDDPSLAGLPERIAERAAGNPFFVEELVRSLADAAALEGERGRYRPARPTADLVLPSSVQTVLAARIDRLPEREKQLLQTAAVIGKEVPERLLQEVAGLPEADLRDALQSLTTAELLVERGLYPDVEYGFRHPLTQDVAYGSQLGEARARLHGAAARALAELDADRLDERAALLAHHWEQAGDPLEAARCHARAAGWAALLDPAESLRHWRSVRELLHADESEEATGLRLTACIQAIVQGERMGVSEQEVVAILEEGRELARRRDDKRSLVLLLGAYARAQQLHGRIDGGLEKAEEALRLSEEVGDVALRVAVLGAVPMIHFSLGRLAEGLALLEQGIELAGDDVRRGSGQMVFNPLGTILMARALTRGLLGHIPEARRDLDEAISLMRRIGDLPVLCAALSCHPSVADWAGDPSGTLEAARESLELAEARGSPLAIVMALQALGRAHILHESWADGEAALERGVTLMRKHDVGRVFESLTLASLAEARIEQGDLEAALATAEQAAVLGRRLKTPTMEGTAHTAIARALLARGDAGARERIEDELDRAAALYDASGARSLAPAVLVERAALARLCGDEQARERHLREAHRLFNDVGATGHAQRLAAELGIA
jgi:class 3 adenylate cyclase/tetratricopeptide (TPR) repeat protein